VKLAPHGFPLAHRVIKILRYNDEFRDLDDVPLAFRIRPGDPIAGIRILDHPQPVPDESAAIEIVIQNAGPTLGVAVDGRCIPDPAARRAKAVAIEPMVDVAGGPTLIIVLEDPADDIRLFFDNDPLARLALDGGIAIGDPAARESVPDPAGHPAPHLVGIVLTEQLSHQAP
jgi:hypothetical protein